MLVAPLLGPSQAALERQLLNEYQSSCAAVGYDRAHLRGLCDLHPCRTRRATRTSSPTRRSAQLTDEDRALWLGYADQCRAKTLPLPDLDGAI